MKDLLSKTKEICRLFEIKPERSKGQNFLVNSRAYDDVVDAADISTQDEVLEIGPGLGFLTVRLAAKAKKVIAVELDDKLARYLELGFAANDEEKVKIINQDILKFNPASELADGYKIVANLPYNITSIFLRNYLSGNIRPASMVLMLQKEVAKRIIATPGEMSVLAVSVQHYADAEIVRLVPAANFWPEPEVESAIIRMVLKDAKFSQEDDRRFFRLVKAGFSAKRKMLKNNLAGGLKLESSIIETALKKSKIENGVRAEDLSLEQWYQLFAALSEFMV